jgi:UDP-N-acetylmuramate--alanine ligase
VKSEEKHIVYFAGIGGIGMSALARWYNHAGYTVFGYDRTPSAITNELASEGIIITFEDTLDAIPDSVKNNKENVLIIYTPALPSHHKQMEYFMENGFTIIKRSEALGRFTKDHFTVAVAGTHGKTTTSSMIAHILYQAGKNCAAFLGGISANYRTNFLLQGEFTPETIIVAEADEFDRSFLRLSPDVAVITSTDADHLDIYGNKENVNQSYMDFAGCIVDKGQLIVNNNVPKSIWGKYESKLIVQQYGLEKGSCNASNIRINQGNFIFDYYSPHGLIEQLQLQVPGFHNVENATAAITVALSLGIDADLIRKALSNFSGVQRRFEYIIKSPEMVFIDDYAHHPTEIEAFLRSVVALYQGKKITAIFQPHLYTRTRDFVDGFAHSLSLATEVLLLDIYPARELPIEGVSSHIILDKISRKRKKVVSKEELFGHLKKEKTEVVLTIGAGDIDRIIPQIKEILENKRKELPV